MTRRISATFKKWSQREKERETNIRSMPCSSWKRACSSFACVCCYLPLSRVRGEESSVPFCWSASAAFVGAWFSSVPPIQTHKTNRYINKKREYINNEILYRWRRKRRRGKWRRQRRWRPRRSGHRREDLCRRVHFYNSRDVCHCLPRIAAQIPQRPCTIPANSTQKQYSSIINIKFISSQAERKAKQGERETISASLSWCITYT